MYRPPTHFNPDTKQFIHVYGQPRYEFGTKGGYIVVDALLCEGINRPQPKMTVYYNPIQSLTFKPVR